MATEARKDGSWRHERIRWSTSIDVSLRSVSMAQPVWRSVKEVGGVKEWSVEGVGGVEVC